MATARADTAGRFVVYGATGYTGTLIAEACARRRLPAVLAGRNRAALEALAQRLDAAFGVKLPFVACSIDEASALDALLTGAACVLHCAGPFSRTSRQMADACLRTGVHYLDITGEIAVFEALAARDAEAKAKGVMLLPGVGFDVVPSDCMAAHVKARLPDATTLRLGIKMAGGLSHGTAATMVEGIDKGGAARVNGRIVAEPAAHRTHAFDVGSASSGPSEGAGAPRMRTGVSVGWGDVSTAFHSTGIPNVETYFLLPARAVMGLKLTGLLRPVLALAPVKKALARLIPAGGPDEATRARSRGVIVAEATNGAGKTVVSRLACAEGYTLTVDTALLCVQRVLDGKVVPGFQTPSRAYGADLVLEAPGTSRVDVA